MQPGLVACVKRVDTCWSSFRHSFDGGETWWNGGGDTINTISWGKGGNPGHFIPNISQPLRHLSDTFSYWPAASADRVRGAFWAIRDPSKTPIPKSSEAATGENRGKSQDGWNCEIKSFQILFGLIGSSNHQIFPDWMFGFIKIKMLKSVRNQHSCFSIQLEVSYRHNKTSLKIRILTRCLSLWSRIKIKNGWNNLITSDSWSCMQL